jgi:hypothetical protein
MDLIALKWSKNASKSVNGQLERDPGWAGLDWR